MRRVLGNRQHFISLCHLCAINLSFLNYKMRIIISYHIWLFWGWNEVRSDKSLSWCLVDNRYSTSVSSKPLKLNQQQEQNYHPRMTDSTHFSHHARQLDQSMRSLWGRYTPTENAMFHQRLNGYIKTITKKKRKKNNNQTLF